MLLTKDPYEQDNIILFKKTEQNKFTIRHLLSQMMLVPYYIQLPGVTASSFQQDCSEHQ